MSKELVVITAEEMTVAKSARDSLHGAGNTIMKAMQELDTALVLADDIRYSFSCSIDKALDAKVQQVQAFARNAVDELREARGVLLAIGQVLEQANERTDIERIAYALLRLTKDGTRWQDYDVASGDIKDYRMEAENHDPSVGISGCSMGYSAIMSALEQAVQAAAELRKWEGME